MEHKTKQQGLLVSVIALWSILIAWSMIFAWIKFSWGVDDEVLKQKITEWIEDYIQEQQNKQANAQQDQEKESIEKAKNLKPVSKDDHIRWSVDADITFVEYSDFECPYCKNFHETVKQVMTTYWDKINWVYRHYPLPFHWEIAQKESEASECVASLFWNEKFWEYTDLIYATTKSNWWLEISQLYDIADEISVDRTKLKECVDSWEFKDKVAQDLEEGWKAWVNWTPWNFIIDNKTWDIIPLVWAQPLERIKAVIDWVLEK